MMRRTYVSTYDEGKNRKKLLCKENNANNTYRKIIYYKHI